MARKYTLKPAGSEWNSTLRQNTPRFLITIPFETSELKSLIVDKISAETGADKGIIDVSINRDDDGLFIEVFIKAEQKHVMRLINPEHEMPKGVGSMED